MGAVLGPSHRPLYGGTWLGAHWEVTVSIGMATAYLGPYGIDTLFLRWTDWKFTKDEEEDRHGN